MSVVDFVVISHHYLSHFICFFRLLVFPYMGFPHSSVRKESACNAGDLDSIPGSGRSPGEGNGNPLQYSFLENPVDRGAWQATVHVRKSWTWRNQQFPQYVYNCPTFLSSSVQCFPFLFLYAFELVSTDISSSSVSPSLVTSVYWCLQVHRQCGPAGQLSLVWSSEEESYLSFVWVSLCCVLPPNKIFTSYKTLIKNQRPKYTKNSWNSIIRK